MSKGTKMIPRLWTENLKIHTLSRGTYLNTYIAHTWEYPLPSHATPEGVVRCQDLVAGHRTFVAEEGDLRAQTLPASLQVFVTAQLSNGVF